MGILTLLFTLIVIWVILKWFYYYWNIGRKLEKIPQRKGHFLFGNLELFTGKLFVKHNIPLYQRIVNGYKVIFTDEVRDKNLLLFWLAFVPYIIMTNAKSVEQLLTSTKLIEKSSDYEFFKPWLSTGLLTSGSEKWKSRRKFLTPSFHFQILNQFIPIMNKHSKILVNKFKDKINQSLDITKHMQLISLDVICETAMGVSVEAQASPESKYVQAVLSSAELIFSRIFNVWHWIDFIYYKTENGRNFKKSIDFLHSFTDKVIESRKKAMIETMKKNVYKDVRNEENESMYFRKRKEVLAFMDLLIKRHLEGLRPDGSSDFSLSDIREEVDTFMFEGFDTTSAALTWTLHLLGLNLDAQEKAYQEIHSIFGDDTERQITDTDLRELKYVKLCIKEVLRLYPSVPIFARSVTEEVNICGYTIPKNSIFVVYTYGLHRDPNVFPDPESYVPERFLPEYSTNLQPFSFVPFSGGARNCIGQKLAMMEMKITITEILRNFKVQSLNKNISFSFDLILKPREAVLIRLVPRL